MKCTLPRAELSALLNTAKGVASGNSLPILGTVRFEATKHQEIQVTSTDLDMRLLLTLKAHVSTPGALCVNADKFARCIAMLADDTGEVSVELEADDKARLSIRSGGTFYKLSGYEPEEFPPGPNLGQVTTLTLPQAQLKALLENTGFASSTDESRAILCGTRLELNGSMGAVATDGRRLARAVSQPTQLPNIHIVLPDKAVDRITSLCGEDGDVSLSVAADAQSQVQVIQFNFGHAVFTTKLIDGNYPNWKQVVPAFENGVEISRADLLAAARRAAAVGEHIRLRFKDGTLLVTMEGDEGEFSDLLMVPRSRPERHAQMNVKYLIDALAAVGDEQLVLHLKDELSPLVLRRPDESWFYVLMPVRIPPKESITPKEKEAPSEPAKEAPAAKAPAPKKGKGAAVPA